MYARTLTKVVKETSRTFPVLMITGPRQVGKTTLLESLADQDRGYVSLDDLEARSLAQQDPGLFIQTYPPPVIIDEVQYAPSLFSAIKMAVHREKKNGLYWLTGSQKFHLMKGVTESLAGRVALIDLLGLSQAELDGRVDQAAFLPTSEWIQAARHRVKEPLSLEALFTRIWKGSFPKLYQEPTISHERFYQSYVATYIQRDVKDIVQISDDMVFARFLRAVAARTATLLNYADLARDVGIDQKTAKAWLSVLETAGLIYLLHPYHNNVTKRLLKAPKLYFLDTGLCAHLTKWLTPASLEAGALSGAMLETYVFGEILKSYWHNGHMPSFYYYRDTDQREIDLLIETGEALYPVEIKKTGTPSHTASKHFHVLEKFGKKVGPGAVVCSVPRDVPLSRDVHAIPVSYL